MSKPRILTEKRILELPHRAKRYDVPDGDVRGLFVRVGSNTKTFVLVARFGDAQNSTRRKIGEFPNMPLQEARAIAIKWNAQVRSGLDPELERKRAEDAILLQKRCTFEAAMEDHIAWLPSRPRNRNVKNDIASLRRYVLGTKHRDILQKPVGDITGADMQTIIEEVRDKPAATQALNVCTQLNGFFSWILTPLTQEAYGIGTSNPMANIKPGLLGLRKNIRTHLIKNDEVRAYWRAAEQTPYPYGPYFKTLLLAPVRKGGVEKMRWSQIDWTQKIWTNPENVDKMGQPHMMPLCRPLMTILRELRDAQPDGHGDFVFSTTGGQKPINGGGKPMEIFRRKAEAALAEIDPTAVMSHFVQHDDRRFARTAMEAMQIPKHICELIIGHRRRGMEGIYNQHRYLSEMREALKRYSARLMEIVAGTAVSFGNDVPDDD